VLSTITGSRYTVPHVVNAANRLEVQPPSCAVLACTPQNRLFCRITGDTELSGVLLAMPVNLVI
jgi:hypothetical protein